MKEEINRATEEDATLMFDGYTDDAVDLPKRMLFMHPP
jgi:hypothetical protein